MKKKLILFNTLLVVLALLLMFGLGVLVTRNEHYVQAEEKIREITRIYANNYSTDADFTKKVSEDIRVTVVDATGRVIADSEQVDLSTLENHITREEIVAALNDRPTTVTRQSDTMDAQMMYYAEKVPVGDSYVFIRVAIPVDSVNSYIYKSVVPMLFIMLLALSCSVCAGVFLSSGLLKPLDTIRVSLSQIGRGSYSQIPPTTDDEDINRMLSAINDISVRLQDSMLMARGEKEKLDYILNHISDGIVVTDKALQVVLTNRRAESIFGVKESVGRTVKVLTANQAFLDAMQDCAEKQDGSIFQLNQGSEWYLCTVHRTENDLLIAVLTDITATKDGEKVRLEFFANASHELKTPLTTIKGFNDMITLEAKGGNLQTYAGRIDREVTRMLALIDDMLNLSQLETAPAPARVDVSLSEVAAEVVDNLKGLAESRHVTVAIHADEPSAVSVLAAREHMYELIKNLTENAIRYNNEGGRVDITLTRSRGDTVLTVSDNGIGIDAEHQGRIFERFYRVDKSRSRATGGTGLGLAIVKHICELYGAEISIRSKLGAGTTITVVFGK